MLQMLLAREKITREMIALLDKWRHTGFNVFAGPRILPRQEKAMENLARYIIRASFSQERMTYHRDIGQVEYKSKDGSQTRAFDAVEWLAAMCIHVPNKGEQMVRYYGFYSNAARGKRKKAGADDKIPCLFEPELTGKTYRKNLARLIQKIYEVDPLICPKCASEMKVIAFIHDEEVIRKIPKHLGLWDVKRKLPPRAHAPPMEFETTYNESLMPTIDDQLIDVEYPVEAYF